ncbi:MAG: hypothetical protein KDG55_05855 [Rhodocyclaceae bacterium]|nr:hypothetical protein [Rhodocyclaceae bacterium]
MDFHSLRSPAARLLKAALALLTGALLSFSAQAQATRTWVSGVGDDANPCSRTAPCKTFAGAISKTAAGGEINALDPGGFGAVTITKAITIDGGAGQVASVLTAGTNGIAVVAGATDNVILRNLSINGLGNSLSGISFTSGRSLHVQNVKIDRFDNCISIAPTATTSTVQVIDVALSNCGDTAGEAALAVKPTGAGAATVFVDHVRMLFSQTGILSDSAGASVRVSNSTIFGNQLGLSATNGGAILSFGNNQTAGNVASGAFTGSASSN